MENESHEAFGNCSEDYYERLVAGKSLELKVVVAIMSYATERAKVHTLKPAKIRVYEPLLESEILDRLGSFDTR